MVEAQENFDPAPRQGEGGGGALKVEGQNKGPNPYANVGQGAAPAGMTGLGGAGNLTHAGTYGGGGTRSRLENSSFHRQSSSYASLFTVLLVIGVLVGGGLWSAQPGKGQQSRFKVDARRGSDCPTANRHSRPRKSRADIHQAVEGHASN